MRGILPERLLVLAKVRQGANQLVLRVQLQDRLRGRAQLTGARQKTLELPIHAALRRNQANGALGQPVRHAHIRDLLAESRLYGSDETRHGLAVADLSATRRRAAFKAAAAQGRPQAPS